MANWQERFDRLLNAMSQGEPHKAQKRSEYRKLEKPINEADFRSIARKSASAGRASGAEPDACSNDTQTPPDTSGDASG
jgi:hypothetical protein